MCAVPLALAIPLTIPVGDAVAVAAPGGGGAQTAVGCPLESSGGAVSRPTSGGADGFRAPALQFRGAHVVVHFVTSGADAPRAGDADRDGYPDYVEQIAAAADEAIAFYANPSFRGKGLRGFDTSFCDAAGRSNPNEDLDIYVKDMPSPGLAITPERGEDGAFLLIHPRLERPRIHGGLRHTVAHELFHVVQFNYVPGGVPRWIAEGTANTMAFLFEGVDHESLLRNVDRWFREPHLSLYHGGERGQGCDRCYGGTLFWGSTHDQYGTITLLFERLQNVHLAGRPLRLGLTELEDVFAEIYERGGIFGVGRDALYLEMRTLAEGLLRIKYRPRAQPPPVRYTLQAVPRARSVDKTINGLAAHYVPIVVPARAKGVEVSVTSRDAGPPPHLQLGLGFRPTGDANSLTRLRWSDPYLTDNRRRLAWRTVIATNLRSRRERNGIRLIVSSSRASVARYRVTYRACLARCPEHGEDVPE